MSHVPWKCFFCGKPRREVKHLVAGKEVEGAAICDECVGVAMLTLCGEGWIPPTVTISLKVDLDDVEAGKIDRLTLEKSRKKA